MNKKKRNIIVIIIIIIVAILALWISGVIPKQIARISATSYLKKNFPKMQLEYVGIEWSSSFGGYSVSFKDKDNNMHGFIMNNKYFPISPGQGIFALEEEYWEKYGEPKDVIQRNYVELEKVPLDYDFAQMVEDKCYIVMNSDIVYHIQELDSFIKNVKRNVSDKIRMVRYTIEGQPILIDLEYKNNKFILRIDNRRDGYASNDDKKIITKEYDKTKYELVKENTPNRVTNLTTYYSLVLKGIETNETIPICNYAEVKRTSNENFKIQFNKNGEEITKVLGKEESDKYDYNIYSYKGTVDILIGKEKMSLRDALISGKIDVKTILEKARKDAKEDGIIFGDAYLDGGSTFYIYNDYSILKLNTLGGNKDLYIGVPSMNINDIDIRKSDLPSEKNVIIEYNAKTVKISNDDDINKLYHIVKDSKYNEETCDGIYTHKITIDNETYYLKESCKAIEKGGKQAEISQKDVDTILKILDNNK